MSWTHTHRRWAALQEIETLAAAGCTDLPWNSEYAEIFGDRDGLAANLRYRVRLAQSTQLDTHLSETVLEEQRARLLDRHAGILRMLQSHEQGSTRNTTPQPLRILPNEPISA